MSRKLIPGSCMKIDENVKTSDDFKIRVIFCIMLYHCCLTETGVMEYWSIGVMEYCIFPITPSLLHSTTPRLNESGKALS